MMLVLALAIALFVVYNAFILWKYKSVPVSLSEITYIASPTCFSAFIGTEALLLLVPWIAKAGSLLLPYLSTVCLIICASAPLFREDESKLIHYSSACIALLLFFVWIVFFVSPWWLVTLVVPAGLTIYKRDCWVYWIEIWAFLQLGVLLV